MSKSTLAITPEITDFVTEVAVSNMLEIHRAFCRGKRKGGCSFRQSPAGRPYEDIELVQAASGKGMLSINKG